MRVTLRAVLLFAAGLPITLALILLDEALWPLGVAYLALAALVTGADGLGALPQRALEVEVSLPEVLFIGDRDGVRIQLSAQDGWPAALAEIACDLGANLEMPPLQRARIRPGQSERLSLPLVPKRRGAAEVHRLWLRWYGPLRLMTRQRVQPVEATIPVVPNVRAVRTAAIRFWARDALFGIKPQTQQGEGSEFESLRDYVPGFDHRAIDWKHSARHRRLVCKEFRAERNHQIILAFDTGHLMSEPLGGIPKLDHAVNAGLLLGYVSLRGGDRVGIFGFDSQVRLAVQPVGGVHHFNRLQWATAELEYRQDETNFTLGLAELLTRLNRRSLVILQTEFVDTITAELMVENLARVAGRHLVILVTMQDPDLRATVDRAPDSLGALARSVIAGDLLRERMIVLERLRRLGVHCLHAPIERIGTDLVNRYLSIRRRELI